MWKKVDIKSFYLDFFPFSPYSRILFHYLLTSNGLMSRVCANGLGDHGTIPGRVIPKTQKIVLDAALFGTQHIKVRIKDKVEQSREMSSALPYTFM